LQKDFFCIAFDLPAHGRSPYEPHIVNALEKTVLHFTEKPILIGYSMGGRIALALSKRIESQGLILLSAHTGLHTQKEKQERYQEDCLWIDRLHTLPSQEFLSLWYQQPVFSSLQKKQALLLKHIDQRSYKNPKELALVLEEMSLAHQTAVSSFSIPTSFLYGIDDLKYKKLYEAFSPSAHIQAIPSSGHAVLVENPKGCLALVRKSLSWIAEQKNTR
jgi:2-succinyl-6-hydroxy-2,4-cyclohexadiene-1-carboxylate synthase